jgi:hypothetical protein
MTPECQHIKTSGEKCRALALRGQPHCYFHTEARPCARACPGLSAPLPKALADLSGHEAISNSLAEVARAVAENRLDSKRAGLILYALQIASGNLKSAQEIVSSEVNAAQKP